MKSFKGFLIEDKRLYIAQQLLDMCHLDIVSNEALDQWNREKDECAMFARDAEHSEWSFLDDLATKDFYIHDITGNQFALARKAWVYFEDDVPYDFAITDSNNDEITSPDIEKAIQYAQHWGK